MRKLMIGAAVAGFLAGCAGEVPLEEIPAPPALSEMEAPIRQQYTARRAALDRVLADEGASTTERAEAFGELGNWFHAHRIHEPAKAAYRNAEILAEEDFRWPYYLGHIHLRQGDGPAAAEKLNRALAMQSDYVPAMVHLGELALEDGDQERAATLFESALEMIPDNARAFAGLGNLALEKRDYAAAVKSFEAAMKQQADASSLNYALGMAYRGLGDLDKASIFLEKARIGGNIDRVQLAMTDPLIDTVNALKRDRSTSRVRQAEMLFDEGRYTEAYDEIQRVIAETEDSADLRFLLGLVLRRLERFDEAVQEYREALRLRPDHSPAHFQLGIMLAQQGNDAEAEEHYRQAIEIDPGHRNAYFRLGRLLQRNRRCDEALPAYEKAIELSAAQVQARFGRAVCLLRQNRWQEAMAGVEEGLRVVPQAHSLRHLQARLLAVSPDADLRDGQRALGMASRAAGSKVNVQQIETLAMAHAELGQFDAAVEWQERAVQALSQGQRRSPEWASERLELYKAGQPTRRVWGEGEPEALTDLFPAEAAN